MGKENKSINTSMNKSTHNQEDISSQNSIFCGLKNSLKNAFNEYPDFLQNKKKVLSLLDEQEKIFWKIKESQQENITNQHRDTIYETITDKDNITIKRYIYNLQNFIKMVEEKLPPLSDSQKTKLAAAFLITQDGFANKARKTWWPAFSHILEVVNLTLETENCTFQRVLKALLHDNIEDLKDFDIDEYKYMFDIKSHHITWKNTTDLVLELSHKPWYHRIWFLPIYQRKLLHDSIQGFIENNPVHEKTKKFLIQLKHNNPNNTYEWLDSLWHVMDPDDADQLRKELKNNKKTKDIMKFVMAVSDFRFFDKKLTDDNLAIKFADRLQNTQKLFDDPIKSVLSLFETQYHFIEQGKDNNKKNTKERMKAYPLKKDPTSTHYDVLAHEISKQKQIARQQLIEKDRALPCSFEERYQKGYQLYIKKTEIISLVDKNRHERISPSCKNDTEKTKILEQEIDILYREYQYAEQVFSDWMNIL